MTDNTLSMMEVHPQIIMRNRYRNAIRQAGVVLNESLARLYEADLRAIEPFSNLPLKIGSIVPVRLPQRFQV